MNSSAKAQMNAIMQKVREETPEPSSSSRNQGLPPLTKGIEFEFAIVWRFDESVPGRLDFEIEGESEIRDGYVIVSRSKLNKTPYPLDGDPNFSPFLLGDWAARRAVYDLLKANGIEVNPPNIAIIEEDAVEFEEADKNHRNAGNTHDPKYLRWGVIEEQQCNEFSPREWNNRVRGPFMTVDVELTTPAMTNIEESDAEIQKVINLITDNLIFFTHWRCGLHHHVGMGRQGFPLDQLKMIAAVLYAVETWFLELHPEERLESFECKSLRGGMACSTLSQGMTVEEARQQVQTIEPDYVRMTGPAREAPGLFDALLVLLRADSKRTISGLLNARHVAYNFKDVHLPRGTIEFRQAAGTLNVEWIMHWSKLVCGIVDWARRASLDDIGNYIQKAMMRESNTDGGRYDLDDLVRNTLKLPKTADYLKNTTPDSRATPRVTGQQAAWRAPMTGEGNFIGPNMKPREDWP
ncbi:hypothetical protein LQW54_007722 [Pestalotiopsis sp. IQ-011]